MLHRLTRHFLAVDLEHAGATATDTAHVVERKRAGTEAVVLKVELQGVFAGCECIRAFPSHALEVDQVPNEHEFSIEHIEPVAAEATACVTIIPSPACSTPSPSARASGISTSALKL